MDWRVKWTDPALEDLEAALLDLSERANANVANSFHAAVFKSTKLLETFPEMGAIYEWDESR